MIRVAAVGDQRCLRSRQIYASHYCTTRRSATPGTVNRPRSTPFLGSYLLDEPIDEIRLDLGGRVAPGHPGQAGVTMS